MSPSESEIVPAPSWKLACMLPATAEASDTLDCSEARSQARSDLPWVAKLVQDRKGLAPRPDIMLLRSKALNVTRLQPSFLSSCRKFERLCPYGSSKQCRGRHTVLAQQTATTEAPSALLIEPWTGSAEQQQVGPQCMQLPAQPNCSSAPGCCSGWCTTSAVSI